MAKGVRNNAKDKGEQRKIKMSYNVEFNENKGKDLGVVWLSSNKKEGRINFKKIVWVSHLFLSTLIQIFILSHFFSLLFHSTKHSLSWR